MQRTPDEAGADVERRRLHELQESPNRGLVQQTNRTPVRLARRAPLNFTLQKTVQSTWRIGSVSWNRERSVSERKSQCIRFDAALASHDPEFESISAAYAFTAFSGINLQQETHFVRRIDFPYPSKYKQILREGTTSQQPDPEVQQSNTAARDPLSWRSVLGFKSSTDIDTLGPFQPLYVVMGIFPRGQAGPLERVAYVYEPSELFSRLHWAAFHLRGFGGTFLSLRHIVAFRLYECNAEQGTHELINLDDEGISDLRSFLETYRKWKVKDHIAHLWAVWIHDTINNQSKHIHEGKYMIGIVLGWSAMRISVVVCFPIVLSLAIGMWINSSNWTDLATIQTAWGTASYIVTAGGIFAALLAILSEISDT